MKLTLITSGIVLLLLGTVGILQGAGILSGSFMPGNMRWAVIGAIVDVVGLALLMIGLSLIRRNPPPESGSLEQ